MDVWLAVQVGLIVFGIPLAVRGLRREWKAIWLPVGTPDKVLQFFRGFRMSIIGLAFVGIGAGWMLDQTWLILISVAIGIEETIESSIDVFALTKGKDLRLGPAISARLLVNDQVGLLAHDLFGREQRVVLLEE